MYSEENNVDSTMESAIEDTKKNSKYKILIGLLAIGIVGMVVGIIWVIGCLFPSYHIRDYEDVAAACEEVLDLDLEKGDLETVREAYAHIDCSIVDWYEGYGNGEYVISDVAWIEFSSTKGAKNFYSYMTKNFESDIKTCSFYTIMTGSKKSEFYWEHDGLYCKDVALRSGKYVVFIDISGDRDKEEIVALADKLVEELD